MILNKEIFLTPDKWAEIGKAVKLMLLLKQCPGCFCCVVNSAVFRKLTIAAIIKGLSRRYDDKPYFTGVVN